MKKLILMLVMSLCLASCAIDEGLGVTVTPYYSTGIYYSTPVYYHRYHYYPRYYYYPRSYYRIQTHRHHHEAYPKTHREKRHIYRR